MDETITRGERLAAFWTRLDSDPRVIAFNTLDNVRWQVFTNVQSLEEKNQLHEYMVAESGLRPDQFEVLFSED